jgi:hypothetical protein
MLYCLTFENNTNYLVSASSLKIFQEKVEDSMGAVSSCIKGSQITVKGLDKPNTVLQSNDNTIIIPPGNESCFIFDEEAELEISFREITSIKEIEELCQTVMLLEKCNY